MLVWDVIGIGEVRRREECSTMLQRGYLHSKANNGQAGVGFLINKKWKDHIVTVNIFGPRVIELVLCITKHYKLRIKYMHQRHHPQKQIDSFYNDVDETLGKPNHYTIVMGDFIEQIGKRTSPRNGNGQIWTRIEKRKRRHLGRMSIIKKVQNHEYHVPGESREKMDMEKPNQCNEGRN